MGIIVIVAYEPKHGKEETLDLLMKSHVRRLRYETSEIIRYLKTELVV
jgi:hypothetical protein